MRIWLKPDRLAQLKMAPADVIAAVNEQNAQFAAGKVGQSPINKGQDLVFTVTTQGRLAEPKQFEQIIVRANPDGSTVRLGDVARVELGSKDYEFNGRYNGKPATLVGIFLSPGANALDVAKSVQQAARPARRALPRRPLLPGRLRHHALRRGVDPRGGQDADRGDDPGVPRRLPVPAELARGDHPVRRGAGRADRHLRGHPVPRLLDQHADAVRHGAVDRHRRRRRDRRAGERRAHHARAAPRPARRGDQGDARGHRTDHRDRADAGRGVRADRVPGRPDRRALSPVRGDHLDLGGDLRRRRADALARAVRADPEAPSRAQGLLPLVQPVVRERARPLHARRRVPDPPRHHRAVDLRPHGRGRGADVADHAGQPRARRGPGLLHHRGHPSRRRDARAHAEGGRPGGGGDPQQPEQQGRGRVHRLRLHRRRLPQQRGDAVRHAGAVGRPHRDRPAAGRRAVREDRGHQGGAGAGVQPAADLRPRHHGRLRVLHPEPRRRRIGEAQRGEGRAARPPQHRQAAGRRADAVARRGPAALRRRRPREGQEGGRADQRHLQHPVGDAWARTTSTTSTSTAAPGRC